MRPTELTDYLRHHMKAAEAGMPTNPILIRGAPGIGKTDIVGQVAAEFGLGPKKGFEKLDLLVREPTDVGGLPYPGESDGERFLDWLAPAWSTRLMAFYEKTGKPSIAFIDDIGAATPNVQVAALRLLLERESGAARLPPNCLCVAATNRATDKTVHYRMPSPLANRFTWLSLDTTWQDWAGDPQQGGGWAVVNGMDHRIIAFHRSMSGNWLYEKEPKNDSAFASPRSWAFLSRELAIRERFGGGLNWTSDKDLQAPLLELLNGVVGEAAGMAFWGYLKLYSELVNVDDILSGKTSDFPRQPDRAYALCSALAARFIANPNKKHAERVLDYSLSFKQKEFAVVLVRDVINGLQARHAVITENPGFDRWVNVMGKLFGGA